MAKTYTDKEMWDVFEKLPEELQKAVFSVENANYIHTICKRYDIDVEKKCMIATFMGRVLMGLLTPKEFKQRLKEEVGLSPKKADNLYRGINRFIFMPVREPLSALYGVEIEPTQKPKEMKGVEESELGSEEEKPEKPPSEDNYREPIE